MAASSPRTVVVTVVLCVVLRVIVEVMVVDVAVQTGIAPDQAGAPTTAMEAATAVLPSGCWLPSCGFPKSHGHSLGNNHGIPSFWSCD